MHQYTALRARSRILSYYSKTPHEAALGKEDEPFKRAKAEWIHHAKMAIAEVEEMQLSDFLSAREEKMARKPTECPECGQEFLVTPNV